MRRRKEKGCLTAAVVIIVLVCMLSAVSWYIKREYRRKQDIIERSVSELPRFDRVSVAKKIAENNGFTYPVPAVTKSPEFIVKEGKKLAEELTANKFPLSLFAKRQTAVLKKYRVAKAGDRISFIMNTTGETVSGILKGVFKDSKGRFVKVDFHEYRLPDIMEDYYYLFVPAIATQKAEKVLKELRRGFKENKSAFMQKTRLAVTEKLYKKSGYIKHGNDWIPNSEFLEMEVARKEADFLEKLKSEKEKIYEQNKLFGLIGVDLISESPGKEQ